MNPIRGWESIIFLFKFYLQNSMQNERSFIIRIRFLYNSRMNFNTIVPFNSLLVFFNFIEETYECFCLNFCLISLNRQHQWHFSHWRSLALFILIFQYYHHSITRNLTSTITIFLIDSYWKKNMILYSKWRMLWIYRWQFLFWKKIDFKLVFKFEINLQRANDE